MMPIWLKVGLSVGLLFSVISVIASFGINQRDEYALELARQYKACLDHDKCNLSSDELAHLEKYRQHLAD